MGSSPSATQKRPPWRWRLSEQRVYRTWHRAWPVLALVGLIALIRIIWPIAQHPWDNDAFGFWMAWKRDHLYAIPWLTRGAYVYSPAFAEVIRPWAALSWHVAWRVWVLLQTAALVALIGPILAPIALLFPWPAVQPDGPAVYATLQNGNPELLLAAAIALAMRWPAAWSFALLTKVTPGLGMIWYAVRRDYRSLAVALGVTLLIVVASFAVAPHLWTEWFGLLAQSTSADTLQKEPILPLPFLVRLPIALLVLILAARANRRWPVPIATCLLLPAIQLGGFVLLLACIPIWCFETGRGWLLWPWIRPSWLVQSAQTSVSEADDSPVAEGLKRP
jgi:hypothetical protein